MKKLKRILVETFVILLTQVLDIRAGCSWDSSSTQTDCAMSCTSSYSFSGSETPEQVMALLDETWKEVTEKDFILFNPYTFSPEW